ncbi:MAG: tetraacyldisaccharide 4'-kinase, partial [Nitrospirae bacterium]|nr:tetraacyldisaccharide 4'-kinase [Nitrospirota bacterium]
MGPFSSIYNMILSVREFLYRTSLKDSKRLPSKVVSIGNLTLGGTGKTPAVIALAQEAKKRGFKPCVL